MATEASIYLHCNTAGSDKVYNIHLIDVGDGKYDVFAEYARRGAPLNKSVKSSKVSYPQARAVYDKLIKTQKAKDYYEISGPGGSAKPSLVPVPADTEPGSTELAPQLLNDAESAEKYLDDPMFFAEQKHDGERRMIVSKGDITQAYGVNKKRKRVALPQVVIDSLDPDYPNVILDGEMVGETFHVFDVLSDTLRGLVYYERRKELDYMSFGPAIKPVYTAETNASKRALFERLKEDNAEGIVFKRANAAYEPNRPNKGGNHLKFKFVESATCVVSAHTVDKRSVELQLNDDETSWTNVGKVTIPPNHAVPEIGAKVEVQYLYAYKGGSLYQPVYKGERNDCSTLDCSMNQLKYKPEAA